MDIMLPRAVYYRMKVFNSYWIVKKSKYSIHSLRRLKRQLYSITKSYNIDLSEVFSVIDQLMVNNTDKHLRIQLSKLLSRIIRCIV